MPAQSRTQRPWAAIAAVTALTLPLGSIYAFSVFLKPIEAELGIPRSALSFVFGLATVGFTLGMNLAPLLYRLASPAVLIMTNAVAAALGIELASRANGLPMLLLGYSVVFGIAGGTIFIILQQAVNLLVRTRTGLLNGYVLGLYPMGAMIAAPMFGWSNELHGYRVTLIVLAAALLVFGIASTWLTIHASPTLPSQESAEQDSHAERHTAITIKLCAVFFLAAGLAVLSEARGLLQRTGSPRHGAMGDDGHHGGDRRHASLGRVLVDRFPVPFVSASSHVVAMTGTIILSLCRRPRWR